MKKISLLTSLIIVLVLSLFSFGGVVLAEKKTDLPMCDYTYTDSSGETKDADSWCGNFEAINGCNKNCSSKQFDFCAGNRHYHFGCECLTFARLSYYCKCKPSSAWYEECTGDQGCQNWDCDEKNGCSGGKCTMEKLACPDDAQCCPANDSMYKEKKCTLVGQACEGYECVSQPCPASYECCKGTDGYLPKECSAGYYCSTAHTCISQPSSTLADCPWQCCVSELGYKDKLCSSGECINHLCKSGAAVNPGGTTPGVTTLGGEGGIENPLGYDNFKDLASAINKFIFTIAIALAPVLFVIGGLMIVTAGGNPLQIQKAQKIILYTAIGLVVILLAQAFVAVLRNVIGVKEATTYLPLIFSSLGLELKKRKVE